MLKVSSNQDRKWFILQSHCVAQSNPFINGCLVFCAKLHEWQTSDRAERQRKQPKSYPYPMNLPNIMCFVFSFWCTAHPFLFFILFFFCLVFCCIYFVTNVLYKGNLNHKHKASKVSSSLLQIIVSIICI